MALVGIGSRRREDSLVGALAECHERIRRFSQLAIKLESEPAPAEERGEVAKQLVRYFSEALPRHVADEEQSLRPRLAAAGLDEALARMAQEHEEHQPLLDRLLERWRAIAAGERRADPAAAADARALAEAFERHLIEEERVLFPAVAQLPAAVQAAIREQMRARRG
jgi:hemerythrin-like domain-containing protein